MRLNGLIRMVAKNVEKSSRVPHLQDQLRGRRTKQALLEEGSLPRLLRLQPVHQGVVASRPRLHVEPLEPLPRPVVGGHARTGGWRQRCVVWPGRRGAVPAAHHVLLVPVVQRAGGGGGGEPVVLSGVPVLLSLR